MNCLRYAQLAAVFLATLVVVGSAAYGITRGLQADSQSGTSGKCGQNPDEIPSIDELRLPAKLPEGVSLRNACYERFERTSEWNAEFFYGSQDGGKQMLIAVLNWSGVLPLQPKGRPTIQLGNLVGYVANDTISVGTTFYNVEFEKDGLDYSVGANLGATNKVTSEELNAVALSIAEA